MTFRARPASAMLAAAAFMTATSLSTQAAAESRSFVASVFYPASYSTDGDCSKGMNIPVDQQYEIELLAAGYTKEQVEQLKGNLESLSGLGGVTSAWAKAIVYRAKVKGKSVSAWINPGAAPDPNLTMVDGKYAFGFNLDSHGADQPGSFEDPKTHEKGVDNQMFRAMGCFTVFRGDEKIIPGAHDQAWHLVQNGMPAWLITLTGDDLSKDGDVTVTFDVSIDHVERDAQSNVLRDMTFRINADPRSHHEMKGQIKNGELTLKEPGDLLAIWGDEMMMERFQVFRAQLNFKMQPDGSMKGLLGGYMPWKDAMSTGLQANMGVDWVGLYYNLRKAADGDPDPKTGENRAISTAYFLEAVPAFAVSSAKSKVAGR
jgi:hypothetical protein